MKYNTMDRQKGFENHETATTHKNEKAVEDFNAENYHKYLKKELFLAISETYPQKD